MIELNNGHKMDFVVASGALGFDGRGWWFEQPWRWLGILRPQEFTIITKTLTRFRREGNLKMWHPWTCVRPVKGGWVNAVRAGRCFATNGPLLTFTVNDVGPGGTIDVTGEPLRGRATAASLSAFEALEVVADGRVIASSSPASDAGHHADVGWLAARCVGGAASPLAPEQPTFAHTSPVSLRPRPRRPAALPPLRKLVDQTREWVETHGRFADDRNRAKLLALCDAALQVIADVPSAGPP